MPTSGQNWSPVDPEVEDNRLAPDEVARIRARQDDDLAELRYRMAACTATVAPRRVVSVGEGCRHDATYLAACLGLGALPGPSTLLVPVDVRAGAGSFHERGATRVETASLTPVVADAAANPFAHGTVDLVVSSLMIDDVDEPAAVVADLVRITAADGHLLIAGHGHDVVEPWRGVHGILGAFHPRQVTTDDIDTWLSAAGATIVQRWQNQHTWLRLACPTAGANAVHGV